MVLSMMNLCSFGQTLVIGSEDGVQTRLFNRSMNVMPLQNKPVTSTRFISFIKVLQMKYLRQFCQHLVEDRVQTRLLDRII